MSADISLFRGHDFEVTIRVDHLDHVYAEEFAAAIYRANPSRLDNMIEIEVAHRPEPVHATVQMIREGRDIPCARCYASCWR